MISVDENTIQSDIERNYIRDVINNFIRMIIHEVKNFNEDSKEVFSYYQDNEEKVLYAINKAIGANLPECADLATYFFQSLEIRGYTETSVQLLKKAIQHAMQEGERETLWSFQNHLGRVEFVKGNIYSSAQTYRNLRQDTSAAEFPSGTARALIGSGVAFQSLKKNTGALIAFNRALELSYELKEPYLTALCHGNIGITQKNVGHFKSATISHIKALRQSRLVNDRRSVGRHYGNLGITLFEMGKTNCSAVFFRRAYLISMNLKDKRHQGIWLTSLSLCRYRISTQQQALSTLDQAIEIFDEIGAKAYYKDAIEKKAKILRGVSL